MPFGAPRPRQQANQNFRTLQEGIEASLALKGFHTGNGLGRAAPARNLEPDPSERRRDFLADHAKTHDADRNFARGRLIVHAPDPLALLRVVEPLSPMVHQHMQHDVFGHPHGEIGMRDAHHRDRWQVGVGEQVVDASPKIDDRFQVMKFCQQTVRRQPDACVGDVVGVADGVRPDPQLASLGVGAQGVDPFAGLRSCRRPRE